MTLQFSYFFILGHRANFVQSTLVGLLIYEAKGYKSISLGGVITEKNLDALVRG